MSSGWQVFQLANDRATYGDTAGCYIVTTGDHDDEICGPILDLRHARLISAAPDLLALAQQYASECGECGGTGYDIARSEFDGRPIRDAAGNLTRGKACQECADIRAAIAKATGAA